MLRVELHIRACHAYTHTHSCTHTHIYTIYTRTHAHTHTRTHTHTYDAGLPHPPLPPPGTPWYPPLPVKWVVVLFGLVAFPVWSCLLRPLPFVERGLWSFWLAPPRLWGAVCVYRGMVWLLPLVSSNVISFWLAPPRLCGAVCSTEIWYGCCRLLAVMSSLRARYHTKYDVALFLLANGAPVPALMRFSAPARGPGPGPGGRGPWAGRGGGGERGGGGARTREHTYM